MADFKTHVSFSSLLGVAYGAGAYAFFDVAESTCLLAGGLCGVAGMLPDLDSGPGRPLRESLAFAAAVVPMMMIDRARAAGMSPESMVLAGAAIYLGIRFGLGWALRHYTVHRGMFHSIPAAIIAGQIAFLVCASGGFEMRLYKTGAVVLGFMSHLLLDEIYSVQITRLRVKKSFGTAIKFFGDGLWPNVSAYGKLALLSVLVLNDPVWIDVSPEGKELNQVASSILDKIKGLGPKAKPMPNEDADQLPTDLLEDNNLDRDNNVFEENVADDQPRDTLRYDR